MLPDDIRVTKFRYDTENKHHNIKWMLHLASRYAADYQAILDDRNLLSRFPSGELLNRFRRAWRSGDLVAALNALFDWEQSLYLLEQEEQFLRPLYFALIGGDCDDQTIATLGFLAFIGYPAQNVRVVEGGLQPGDYEHIFVKITDPEIYIDPLPENEFGLASAPYVREWPLSEVVTW